MPQYLLGTDNGCTVSKAALFTLDGREIAVASRKSQTLTPQPGHFERDIDEMWRATCGAIRQVIRTAGIDPKEIACVAPAGHGNGLYLIDEQGRHVRDAIMSTDARARACVDRWLADGVDRKVLPLTTQSLWPAQPNALLAWLRDHEPRSIEKARWVLMCKDYVRFRLTGEIRAELTDLSGTSLINVPKRDYDPAVLEAFGIAEMRRLLPPLIRSEEIAGTVTPGAAGQTGLAEGTPVAGGVFDIDACGLSSGIVNETQLCMIAGTWGNNQYISRRPVISQDIFMTSCYCIPEHFLMLEGSATSASNLEWFVTQFFEADQAAAAREGKNVYELCNELVSAVAPEDTGILFLPFLYGSNVSPDATSCLLGLNGRHTRGHVLRAIYEGVVFGHKAHVDKLLKFRAMPERIRFTGGAARSEVWVQIFADVFQVPVEIPEGTELGALGAAICAAVAAGCCDSYEQAVDAMVRFARVQEPDPAMASVYGAKYERYRKALAALDPVWKDLA